MLPKIYIVDDDQSVCQALKILLMTYDFDVMTFNSAQSFFDTIPHDQPGCLLLDIHMPVIDGWGGPRAGRQFPGTAVIQILALIAHAFDDDHDASLAAGMNAHIGNPIEPDKLFAISWQWLGCGIPPTRCVTDGSMSV